MIEYPKEFIRQLNKVNRLRTTLKEQEKILQDLCPHVTLDGRSTFPSGISFTECSMCDQSSYYAARGEKTP